nr:hypothetical protein [Tanacetum cinerariifolium]
MKNSLEDGQGLEELMDIQTTGMQHDYREIRVESENVDVLSLSLTSAVCQVYNKMSFMLNCRIMAGRSTHSNTSNDTNPSNETADEVARQLNTALPNLLTQLVQALGGNRVNQREATPSCSIKTFRASGAKEFFGTEGTIGLLTWFESIEAVLHITKCPAESQVEFASSMLQGRALTWWNTLVQTRGRAATIAQSWEDFKKIMAGRRTRSNSANDTNPSNETADEVARQLNTALPNLLTQLVQALGGNRVNQREATPSCSIKTFRASGAKEFFGTEGAVGLLTWFESIEVVLHSTKCLAESQVEFTSSMLQGRALTWWNTLVQTRGRAAAIAHSWEDFKKLLMEEYCPDDEVEKLESEFWSHKMVGSDINGYTARFHELSRLVPHMVTPESQHQGQGQRQYAGQHPRNRAQGRAFTLGVAEAPQDLNVVTSTFSLNDHFAIVLFDSGADYSFISTNFLPSIDIKPSVISPGYEIEITSGVKVVTNMIVRGCRLELEGHTFIIDLIPFGHGSFDVT